jgi:hypothetical protein
MYATWSPVPIFPVLLLKNLSHFNIDPTRRQ